MMSEAGKRVFRRLAFAVGALVLILSAIGVVACSDSGTAPRAEPAVVGNWQAGSGDLLAFIPQLEFSLLQLREDSTGMIVLREPDIKALACIDLVYTQLDDRTLFIDLEPFVDASPFLPKNFTYVVDGDALILGDSVGRSQAFTRLDEPPPGSTCQVFSEVTALAEVEAEHFYSSGLVWDDYFLWLGAVGDPQPQLLKVNHLTGAVESAVDLPSGVAGVQAFAGLRAWFRVPSREIASLRDFADTEVTTINTDLDLGHMLSISAMAWDGRDLWLAGFSNASDRYELLQVDSSAKTLVNEFVFDLALTALTWDGARFWGLADSSPSPIVQIDPDTMEVINTYQVSGYDSFFHEYVGIAAVDGDLFILLSNWTRDPSTTILRATP